MNRHEAMKQLRRVWDSGECLHPEAPHECSKTRGASVVASHAIQKKGGGLNSIAEEGHVYWFDRGDPMNMPGKPIGLTSAATKSMFCGQHDDHLFADVEKVEFRATPRQQVLLAYRSICVEAHDKRRFVEWLKQAKGIRPSVRIEQIRQAKLAIRDTEHAKHELERTWQSHTYDSWRTVCYRVEPTLPFVCAGASTRRPISMATWFNP